MATLVDFLTTCRLPDGFPVDDLHFPCALVRRVLVVAVMRRVILHRQVGERGVDVVVVDDARIVEQLPASEVDEVSAFDDSAAAGRRHGIRNVGVGIDFLKFELLGTKSLMAIAYLDDSGIEQRWVPLGNVLNLVVKFVQQLLW